MKKRIISLGIVLGLLSAMIVPSVASAGSLTVVSDVITPSTEGVSGGHVITFTTAGELTQNDTITLYFGVDDFVVPTQASMTNVTLTDDSIGVTVDADGDATTDTVEVTITEAATIAAGSVVVITITTSTYPITNPSTASTYTIQIVTADSTGPMIDTGYCLVHIGSGRDASITIKTLISATLTDYGSTGINFGAADPSATDVPDDGHNGVTNGAIRVVIESETNVATVDLYSYADAWD